MKRLYLHVGLMKTGTTYLQGVWRANAKALDRQGIWYPSAPEDPSTVFATWDLVGRRPRGASDARVAGQWEAMTRAVAARTDQQVLLSDEYLAARTLRQAKRAVAGFPHHEVHIVVAARDLARVLASSWQENIKNGNPHTWSEFIDAVSDPEAVSRDPARGFWLRHDLPQVLQVWASAAGRDRVHVVTVPPDQAPRGLLLERMGTLVGFDANQLTEAPERTNESIGGPATEVIRRLNERLGGRLNQMQYDWVVKRTLRTGLPTASTTDRLVLPEQNLDWARREAQRIVDSVLEGGFDVVGDLGELVPGGVDGGRAPGEATDAELLESSLQALTLLAEQMANAWWAKRRPQQPRVPPSSQVVRASSGLRGAAFRVRRKGAALADHNAAAAGAMGLYLRLRRRRGRR